MQKLWLFTSDWVEAALVAAYLDKMMEEVSMVNAYDAHAIEQMSEEEIFACLESETGPKFTVSFFFFQFVHLVTTAELFFFIIQQWSSRTWVYIYSSTVLKQICTACVYFNF